MSSATGYDETLSSEHLHVALEAARAAAKISRDYYAGNFTVEKGKPVTFRYRVVIHAGDANPADLDAKFKEYAEKK